MTESIIGFDPALGDDLSLVVMHRGADGTWRVESTEGPDADAIVSMAAGLIEQHRPVGPPEWAKHPVRWGDLVAQWLDEHGDAGFELTGEQRDMLTRFFDYDEHGNLREPTGSLAVHVANARHRP